MSQSQAASGSGHGSKQAMTLVDMPSPWLQQLVEGETEEESLLALLRSCRSMRDLVLSLRDVRLTFTLPIPPDQHAAAQSKLLLACKLSSNVKLHLQQPAGNRMESHASQWMLDAMSAAGHRLAAISTVKVDGLTLCNLVPPWLIGTCPHMTSLQLEDCTFSGLPAPGMALPTCIQLTELHLGPGIQIPVSPSAVPLWHHQLESLPNLTCLSTHYKETIQCVGSVIGRQLTQLELQSAAPDADEMREMVTMLPNLRDLRLTDSVMRDEGRELLHGWQHLTVFRCSGFNLHASHTHRRYRWTQLGFRHLDVASFDHLPLSVLHLLPSDGQCYIIPCDDLAATNRVVEAIRGCGGWRFDSTYDMVVDHFKGAVSSPCLAATLSILCTCIPRLSAMWWIGAHVTVEVLSMLKHHPVGLGITAITFEACTWGPGVWPLLLPSLPSSVTHAWLRDPTVTKAQLTIMCAYAYRPITVNCMLSEDWPDVQEFVEEAMAAVGHEHVQLLIDDDD